MTMTCPSDKNVMAKGHLIAFEGLDAAGKETQARILVDSLRGEGLDAVYYSSPDYETIYGKLLRRYLDKDTEVELSLEDQVALYLLDIRLKQREIKKHLASGAFVVMDRYYMSTAAYQCSKGYPFNRFVRMVDHLELIPPSCVFYMDICPDTSMARSKARGKQDRHEGNQALLRKVCRWYQNMVNIGYPACPWNIVNGEQSMDEISNYINEHVFQLVRTRHNETAFGGWQSCL